MGAVTPEQTARRLGATVTTLRWLAAQLAAESHPLAHVPVQLADALLTEPVGGCRGCGEPLPTGNRTGRPRLLCLACSPRKTPENRRLVA